MLLDAREYERAKRYFQSFYHYDWTWYVLAQFQLGRIYAELGRGQEARERYALAAAWWNDADPALQPWVRQAREFLRSTSAD